MLLATGRPAVRRRSRSLFQRARAGRRLGRLARGFHWRRRRSPRSQRNCRYADAHLQGCAGGSDAQSVNSDKRFAICPSLGCDQGIGGCRRQIDCDRSRRKLRSAKGLQCAERGDSIELAKIAGVSSATISRAFSANSRISTVTRERILSIAREHNYHPNAVARSLNNRQSRLGALVVNTIANPCEAEDLNTLVHRLQQHERMPLVLCCADHNDAISSCAWLRPIKSNMWCCFGHVSIAEAVDIFRSATPIIASFEPVSAPSLACVRIDGAAASTKSWLGWLRTGAGPSPTFRAALRAGWTRSAGAGFPTP